MLSLCFEVDVQSLKVDRGVLCEARGVLGASPPQENLKFRCLEMLFLVFSSQDLSIILSFMSKCRVN